MTQPPGNVPKPPQAFRQKYKRPPITEAIIEVRFSEPYALPTLDRIRAKLASRFPSVEMVHEHNLQVSNSSPIETRVESTLQAFRMTSQTATDVILVGARSATFARLAPYPGWDAFRSQAHQLWRLHQRIAGQGKIERVGVRYINRIDIKFKKDQLIRVEDYVTFYSEYPQQKTGSAARFLCQLVIPAAPDSFDALVTTASVESPVPNQWGLIVDIDVSREKDLPHGDKNLWKMIDQMRDKKNEIFEAAITDKSRELFDRE